jgi:outer membrane protein assembly factor BamB
MVPRPFASTPCRWPRLAPRSFGWYWTWVAGQEPKDQRFGHLTAVDADSGTVLWNNNSDTPIVASGTPTAGKVLLAGATKGTFLAVEAATGAVLLKMTRGDPLGGLVISVLDGI